MLKPVSEMPDDQRFLVSTVSPSREQTRLAARVLLVLLLALIITVPFARVPLNNTEVLLPAYATAVLMSELITSALLFVLFSIQRSRAVLVLAIGYLFTALMIFLGRSRFPECSGLPACSTPGCRVRHDRGAPADGLPAFRAGLCGVEGCRPVVGIVRGPVHTVILGSVAAVVAGVCGLTWLSVADDALLPNLMADNSRVSDVWGMFRQAHRSFASRR